MSTGADEELSLHTVVSSSLALQCAAHPASHQCNSDNEDVTEEQHPAVYEPNYQFLE